MEAASLIHFTPLSALPEERREELKEYSFIAFCVLFNARASTSSINQEVSSSTRITDLQEGWIRMIISIIELLEADNFDLHCFQSLTGLDNCLKMILNGCSLVSGSAISNSKSYYSASTNIHRLASKVPFSGIRISWGPSQELKLWSSKESTLPHLAAASTSLLSGELGSLSHTIPMLPRRQRPFKAPRASKDVPYSFRYPAMTKKPRWWWRTLACLPYLMPLHETWMYAETAYHLHPFLEDFEFLTYPFLGAIGRLPSWFLMAYFFVAYLGVVRKKEWPHFFRFHVVMGMLLEIALQVIGTVSRWMPLAVYWGKIGMHFWTAVAFAYLFTVLECMRCALSGMYADIPFVCDAAYIQIPYD